MLNQAGPPGAPPDQPAPVLDAVWPAEPASVAKVRAIVREFAAGHGIASEEIAAITLAVSEAATNSVVHAFVGREAGKLRVILRAGFGELLVHVIDDGRGMQPRPDSPGLGIGLPTIGKLADRLDITAPAEGGTEVRMVFAAPGVQGVQEPATDAEERMRLLVEVARLSSGAGWPADGVEAMVDLLAPALVDICTVDVLDDNGHPRRLAARVSGDPQLTAWLADRPAAPEPGSPIAEALRHGPQLVEFTEEVLEATARGPEDADNLRRLGTRWWVILPLHDQERLLGVLNLGLLGHRGRPTQADLDYYQLVAERAGRGLANTQLLDEMRRTRRRLEQILGALAEAVTVNDGDGRTVYANPAAARLLGVDSAEQLLETEPGELSTRFRITREDGSPVSPRDFPGQRLVSGEVGAPLLTRSVHLASGREYWLLTKATLLEGAEHERLAVNIIEDVTEQMLIERRYRFLARAGRLLVGAPQPDMPQRIAEMAVEDLADWCTIDLYRDGRLERVALAHRDPEKLALVRQIDERWPDRGTPSARIQGLLSGDPALVVRDLTDDMLAARAHDDEHLSLLRRIGMRSVVVAPLRTEQSTHGTLTLISAESARSFDDADVELISDFAERIAIALQAG